MTTTPAGHFRDTVGEFIKSTFNLGEVVVVSTLATPRLARRRLRHLSPSSLHFIPTAVSKEDDSEAHEVCPPPSLSHSKPLLIYFNSIRSSAPTLAIREARRLPKR